ncbi:MAG: hypothetical protein Q4E31_03750 [Intestinibacter bartlettii]|uniref:vWA domain-containing protein n=1 Tax=Intestinibacter bartlettii TaxID=261299 RepID=UPI0026F2E1F7|nr:hypothetical protein [Intestinibacter bartlettii]MDO5009918.1 hypothetical protein [Intestinibacter bartlettii]
MKENLTELVFILDKSGSMAPLVDDTIGGFNSLIQKQRKEDGECIVTTVLFNDSIDILHNRVSIENIKNITTKEYQPMGCTSLLDAMGSTIDKIKADHVNTPKEKRPDKVLFAIITDGAENSSKEYNIKQIKTSVTTCQELLGWEFLFLGANIDAIETASQFGIPKSRAANYNCDSEGTELNFSAINDVLCCVRRDEHISEGWKSKIEKNFKKKRKNK